MPVPRIWSTAKTNFIGSVGTISGLNVIKGASIWVFISFRVDVIQPTVTGVTDTAGNTYTGSNFDNDAKTYTILYYADNCPATVGNAITINLSQSDLAEAVALVLYNVGNPSVSNIGTPALAGTPPYQASPSITLGAATYAIITEMAGLSTAASATPMSIAFNSTTSFPQGPVASVNCENVAQTGTISLGIYYMPAGGVGPVTSLVQATPSPSAGLTTNFSAVQFAAVSGTHGTPPGPPAPIANIPIYLDIMRRSKLEKRGVRA